VRILGGMIALGTFRIDGTPPVGSGTGFGVGDATTGVRDPLFLRGFALVGERESCLVVSADWCGVMGSALASLRGALSHGAGVAPERVAIHCVHQHDAPLVDFEVETLLGTRTFPRDWWDALLVTCEKAAREAVAGARPVAEVGRAETRIRGYASNRRILGPDGRVRGMRFSRCSDQSLVAEPVGTIDPLLRTIAFRDSGGTPLASMSFYATHPQVSNGRQLYSADAPGEAVRLLSAHAPGRHAFFTGTGGNVTAGRHSSATDLEGNLLRFGRLLADGMAHNLAAMRWEAAGDPGWRTASFPFPANPAKKEAVRATLARPSEPLGSRLIAGPVLGAMEDPANGTYRMSLLSLGEASVLFLPGEPFVEYQLHAQSLVPDRFLAVAANCGDDFLYLPTAAAFAQGGYEVESFCWCTPEIEGRMHAAMRSLLA
jgi:hypothetical protein